MRMMKCCRWALVLWLAVIAFAASVSASQTPTALRCGVDEDRPAQRFFADSEGKNEWKEYRSVDAVPQLNPDGGASARMWAGNNGYVLFRTEEPGEDFAAYTDYCFNPAGQLMQLRFELRTAWGWGYKEEGPVIKGLAAPKMSEFFSTKTAMRITKPEEAGNVSDALRPRLYMRKSQLPFFKLLTK